MSGMNSAAAGDGSGMPSGPSVSLSRETRPERRATCHAPSPPAAPAARLARQAFASAEMDRSRCGSANSRQRRRLAQSQSAARALAKRLRRGGALFVAQRVARRERGSAEIGLRGRIGGTGHATSHFAVTARFAVIARESGRSSIPEAPAIEPQGCGVLDTPLSRGHHRNTGLNTEITRHSTKK